MKPLLIIKGAIFRAWRINLYQPDVTAPLPAWILRRMGAA
jgi:hypothetical protein